jgi:hypothetical protein
MEPEQINPNPNPDFSQDSEDFYTIEIVYRSVDYISIEVKVPKDFDLRNHQSNQFPDFDPLDVADKEFNRCYSNAQASTYWELDEEVLEGMEFLEQEARDEWAKKLKAEKKAAKKKAREAMTRETISNPKNKGEN